MSAQTFAISAWSQDIEVTCHFHAGARHDRCIRWKVSALQWLRAVSAPARQARRVSVCVDSGRCRGRIARQSGVASRWLGNTIAGRWGKIWQYTAASLRIAHGLGWPWRLAWVFWVVPAPLRDAVYRLVARNRYRWFGNSETCMIPPRDYAARFLD
ncbi:MAG: DCC1-like thiol-disulfide oxidoreductase family protein [Usitatibacteraceae bacterium]